MLAALKSIEGEMDRALAEVEARTKFYSSGYIVAARWISIVGAIQWGSWRGPVYKNVCRVAETGR